MYPQAENARWPFALTGADTLRDQCLQEEIGALSVASPYGWGHSIDFGTFRKEGLLSDRYLRIAGLLDAWSWWPARLTDMAVADIGCFTGGITALMSHRGAAKVYAIDEITAHLDQCRFLTKVFDLGNVECVESSAYRLGDRIAPASLDLILLSGVLYHLSDMLVGLMAMQELLKPEGKLIIESNAVECFEHSYANFGRFAAGMWWQPTAKCIQEMCELSGLSRPEVRFYRHGRCLALASKPRESRVCFRRGTNWNFENIMDEIPRPVDGEGMSPADCAEVRDAKD